MQNKFFLITVLIMLTCLITSAHPTGDMVTLNGKVYWSYVCPLNDAAHHACVMRWDEENGVTQWLTSEHSASDWMMYATDKGAMYLIERYYDNSTEEYMARMFYWNGEGEPEVILPWYRDTNRMGEAGFVVLEDGRIVYAKYPSIYVLNNDGTTEVWLDRHEPVSSIRYIDGEHLLIRGGTSAWLAEYGGTVVTEWKNLTEPLEGEAPFMGNIIFDADYEDGNLYLAYWGKRRFDVLTNNSRRTLVRYESPWLPHAVAAEGNTVYMLTSTLDPVENQRINPSLLRMHNNRLEVLWGDSY